MAGKKTRQQGRDEINSTTPKRTRAMKATSNSDSHFVDVDI